MAAELFIPPSKALDANANPYAGAKWFFYATGTTTPQSVYTTFAMGTPHANPVVADSTGKFANIFFDPALVYRGVLKDSTEAVTLHDIDPISSSTLATLAASGGSSLVGFLQAGTGAVARTVQAKMRDAVSVKDFGAVGDGVADDRAAIQAAITSLGANGGEVVLPTGTYKVTSAITIPLAVWKPVVIRGGGNTVITSTHNGIVIDDSTGNIRVQNIRFVGPGLANVNAKAIKSILSQGSIRDCYFQDYRVGIDITSSSGALIQRCHFTLCQEGVRSVSVNPAFSNFALIQSCWFDFCTYGCYFKEMYGVTLDNNAFEFNAVGFYAEDVRKLNLRGCNWFELNTPNSFQIIGASTGEIGKETQVVGLGYTVAAASRFLDLYLPAKCIVKRTTTQAIAHNTDTSILFDAEALDPAGMHSTVSQTDRITIAAGGLYTVTGNLELAAVTPVTGNTVYARVAIWKNGAVIKRVTVPLLDNQPTQVCITADETLANGDYLQLVAYQNTGASVNTVANFAQFAARQLSID